jgi:hypothetical protein
MYEPIDRTQSERVKSDLERLYKKKASRANTHHLKPFLLGVSSTVAIAAVCYVGYSNLDNIESFINSTRNAISHSVTMPISVPQQNSIVGTTTKSTITGIVDSTTLTSSYYWTMVLQGHDQTQQEAEFLLAVPEGSAITRVTLWINGVAQEAAFNSTERVTQAYNSVRYQRWDPLLVTWVSPGVVKIKAFPVSANSDMKIRLGMTSPISTNSNGDISLSMPRITKSNLNFDCQQDVHLESDVPFVSNRDDISSEPNQKGKYANLIKGNIPFERLGDVSITGKRKFPLKQFAVAAKHASSGSFILATQEADMFGKSRLKLEKTNTRPRAFIVQSDEASHRISNLWAIDQIQKAVDKGERSTGVQIAMTYRAVSPVSGATVLATNADYQRFGLHRDFGKVYNGASTKRASSDDKFDRELQRRAPLPMAAPAPSSESFNESSFDEGVFVDGQAPMLQGATNGTAGPAGNDATVIQGVNTPGTVQMEPTFNRDFAKQLMFSIVCLLVGIFLFGKKLFANLKRVMHRPQP